NHGTSLGHYQTRPLDGRTGLLQYRTDTVEHRSGPFNDGFRTSGERIQFLLGFARGTENGDRSERLYDEGNRSQHHSHRYDNAKYVVRHCENALLRFWWLRLALRGRRLPVDGVAIGLPSGFHRVGEIIPLTVQRFLAFVDPFGRGLLEL